MALSLGVNLVWGDTTPTTTSGTYTPTAPGICLLIGITHDVSAGAAGLITSITGASIANARPVFSQFWNPGASGPHVLELWTATSTSTAATVAVALPGTPTGMRANLTEVLGVHVSHGQNGIVQVQSSFNNTSSTAVSCAMDPFQHPANGCFFVVASNSGTATTPKTGWTERDDASYASPTVSFETQFIATPDSQPQATIGSAVWGTIAAEIAGGPSVVPTHREVLLTPPMPQLLPAERFVRPPPPSVLGTITGTLATTNANDTSAAAGTTTVTGTLAKTNANDTLAASGSVGAPVSGTLARTNANDTSAASGTTTVTGSLATTDANDTLAAAGTTTVTGSSATTNANDTLTASGVVGVPVVTPPPPAQQVGGTFSGRRGPYTAVDAELEAILRDDDEILCLI